MKMTTIKCANCGESSKKPLKEIKRQKKLGRTMFFCSQYCSGKHVSPKMLEWTTSEENKKRLKEYSKKYCKNRCDEYTFIREHLRKVHNRVKVGKYNFTDIDLPYLKDLWESQKGRCIYTGVELINPKNGSRNRHINKNYQASLDRIDNSLGYMKGNVQFVSVSVNWLKNRLGDDHVSEFFEIVKNI